MHEVTLCSVSVIMKDLGDEEYCPKISPPSLSSQPHGRATEQDGKADTRQDGMMVPTAMLCKAPRPSTR